MAIENLNWPLMANNITAGDRRTLIEFLKRDERLTQSEQVMAFEKEWSRWLGVRHSVFLNSGSSANLVTLAALKEFCGGGEIIVPPLTWVSDIAAVLHCGFKPVFADIDPRTLGMSEKEMVKKISKKTKAVFLTHILGYNALTGGMLETLRAKKIPLIEDVCESHGATFGGRKAGTFGLVSNFSFYYAHHLSTVEGGMVCTDDARLYQAFRMFRAHGLVRESNSPSLRRRYISAHRDLNEQFIFAFPAYNMRSTEIQAVIGRGQLKRLDGDIRKRNANLKLFLESLDPAKYRTDFDTRGASNYALTLVLKKPDDRFRDRVMKLLDRARVEYRRGTSGGGNQLRQPYLKRLFGHSYRRFPQVEHIHFYGFYIGNYPTLEKRKIGKLCRMLNELR
jgi:CDP-6-deoxy-D-xylo-4-hexulose-3-dehydrase